VTGRTGFTGRTELTERTEPTVFTTEERRNGARTEKRVTLRRQASPRCGWVPKEASCAMGQQLAGRRTPARGRRWWQAEEPEFKAASDFNAALDPAPSTATPRVARSGGTRLLRSFSVSPFLRVKTVLSVASVLASVASLSITLIAQSPNSDWPQFRGRDASGIAATPSAPPTNWSLEPATSIGWKTTIPGLSHSSPIVWGNRVYVTTAVAAEGKPGLVLGDVSKSGIDSATDNGKHMWRLIALDKQSGKVVWDKVAHEGIPRMKRHVKASHASATPATDGRYIVALMGSEGLFAFDMDGTLKWRADLGVMDVGLVDDPGMQWGPASSPVIFGDMVLVQNDRHKGSFLAAYDLATGKEIWRTQHEEYPSWATPAIVRTGARTEIVTNSGQYIRGFDPRTGRELWRLSDNRTQVKVPTPIVAEDVVVVTGGYPPGGRPIYAIRPGGSGELNDKSIAWKTDRGAPYTSTPLIYGGLLYALTDNGILSTYEPKTGERVYQQRVAGGSGFSASPVAANGRLYLASEDGDVYVVKAGRTYELLGTNRMGEPLMATPAISGNTMFIRTASSLVAVR
jgi:outer membrane protein assembly factor BamB